MVTPRDKKVEKVEETPEEQQVQTQVVSENQLINLKLDRILSILESKAN